MPDKSDNNSGLCKMQRGRVEYKYSPALFYMGGVLCCVSRRISVLFLLLYRHTTNRGRLQVGYLRLARRQFFTGRGIIVLLVLVFSKGRAGPLLYRLRADMLYLRDLSASIPLSLFHGNGYRLSVFSRPSCGNS